MYIYIYIYIYIIIYTIRYMKVGWDGRRNLGMGLLLYEENGGGEVNDGIGR